MVTLRSCYLIQWLCCCAAIRFLSEKGSGGRGVTNTGYTCDEQDLRQAAELLELPSVHGSCRKDQLANALQASKEEIQRLLETLGLTSEEILLQQFCQATMNRSARILHETVPARDMACLDTGCLDTMNVSIDKLLNTPLVTAPPSPDLVSDGTTTAMLAEDFQQPRDLLREVLQRFFDRYPSPSFQASTLSLLQGGSRPNPVFQAGGFLISDQVEQEFTRSALLATRWVVEALEILKLEYHNEKVNNLFKGWFKSAADQVKHAVSEHLFNIYMVLIYTRVIKAPSKDPQCKTQGNMAYVRNSCPQKMLPYLQSDPCGERYHFSQPKLYVIHICPITWQSPSLFHVGNIIHEASHHYGTKDLAYGMKACLDLASAQAVSNADQYVYFVQNLMALKYPEKMMRSYRGSGKGDHELDLKIFTL